MSELDTGVDHWDLLARASKHFFEGLPSHTNVPFVKLVDALVDRFARSNDLPKVDEDGNVLDYLLFIFSGHLPVTGHRSMVTHERMVSVIESQHPFYGDRSIPLRTFLEELLTCWKRERRVTLECEWSPMPWSPMARKEAGLSAFVPDVPSNVDFESMRLRGELRNMLRGEFVHFADMPWLGCPHDGFPLATSLTAYVRHRYASTEPWREDAALWQGAMTFGLLEAVIGIHTPSGFLLVPGTGRSPLVLRSENLSMLLFDWQLRITYAETHDNPAFVQWRDHVRITLLHAGHILDEEASSLRLHYGILVRGGLTVDEAADVICAVGTLLEALVHAARTFHENMANTADMYTRFGVATYKKRLVATGWCPFTIEAIPGSLCVLSYASTLEPYVRRAADEHQECEVSHCHVLTIDSENYFNPHVDPACNCPYIAPPLADVTDTISRDGMAALIFDEASNSLSIHDGFEVPYVAISHVWADGLGSTSEVGLPTCQVARISNLVQEISPRGVFWLDSLCIPEDATARRRAISLMAKTYVHASAVLVIEASVRRLCSSTLLIEENLMRIVTSAWMQRVWTLQEGMLAQRLYFLFSDGIIDRARLQELPSSHPLNVLRHPVIYRLLDTLFFLNIPSIKPDGPLPFGRVWSLLHQRATSKPADECLAVAGLLGVDASELLSLPRPGDRLKTLLMMVRELPRDILFTRGPRMVEPGFRWAPRSLAMGPQFASFESDATCTPRGLLVHATVICFPTISAAPKGEDGDNVVHIRCRSPDHHDELYVLWYAADMVADSATFNAIVLQQRNLPVVGSSAVCALVWFPPGVSQQASGENRGPRREDDPVPCEYKGFSWFISETGGTTIARKYPVADVDGGKSFSTHLLVT
ncbi:hypothetical protein C8Q80DRAFT_1267050 [Daedaleopsis nitida]|nr:hypothetical protein C8Q80DRAFT_1267050 [Daedaleopsis nitida]